MELTPSPTFTVTHHRLPAPLQIDPMELSAEVQLALARAPRGAEGELENAAYIEAVAAAVLTVALDTSHLTVAQRFTIGERVLKDFQRLGKE